MNAASTLPVRAAGEAVPPPSRVVAVVGPPNSGKSTLFNRLTGLRQKVANFPGVTVEQHLGKLRIEDEAELDVIDLPGVYSLNPRSEDERVTLDVLMGRMEGVPRPDTILLILDVTNLGRHLVLAAPVLALGLPTLIVLNMADELERRGGDVQVEELARRLGAPVALISAASGEGYDTILQFLRGRIGIPRPVELPALNDLPRCREWAARLGAEAKYLPPAPPSGPDASTGCSSTPSPGPRLPRGRRRGFPDDLQRGRAAHGPRRPRGRRLGRARRQAPPRRPAPEPRRRGDLGGVGSVLVFLPQILILFLFIGLLEDSGYLARAALIADRTMAKVGLQGKSFIPLLSAYACAVPAIMATRTIENKRDRIATILIAPFMTCSARLPVYTLIIAAFLPETPLLGPLLGTRAAALLGLYVLGFVAAVVTARVLKSSVLKSERTPFVLEMPPYRRPTLRQVGLRLLDRSKVFLRRAGTVILAMSILLWGLAHVPLKDGKAPEIADSFAGTIGRTVEPVIEPLGFNWKIGIGLITSSPREK